MTGVAAVAHTSGSAAEKTKVLVEALPYIRRFRGKVIVVKHGGSAIGTGDDLAPFAEDVALLRNVGMLPVVVHGGGPQIGAMMRRLGKEPAFHEGLRVTDAETLDIARMVLVGKVNREIVNAINAQGTHAVGLSGEDASLLTARPRAPELGFVGDVTRVDADVLRRILAEDFVPVVATIGTDGAGQAYNINADAAAAAIAAALRAEKLIYLTDVEGIRSDPEDPGTTVRHTTAGALEALIASGAIAGGMIPKASSCVDAVRGGVAGAHVLDGRTPHALLLEVFTDDGVGTMVTP